MSMWAPESVSGPWGRGSHLSAMVIVPFSVDRNRYILVFISTALFILITNLSIYNEYMFILICNVYTHYKFES